jgi:hypothetical protein
LTTTKIYEKIYIGIYGRKEDNSGTTLTNSAWFTNEPKVLFSVRCYQMIDWKACEYVNGNSVNLSHQVFSIYFFKRSD